jgi:light-regulated signal transduction histidine kinase (bacteriophytochrome)
MVVSSMELLKAQYAPALDEKANRFIHYGVDGAQRMSRLVGDLLAFSRLGSAEFVPSAFDAGLAVRAALRALESAIAEAEPEIVVDPLPTVMAMGPLMTQLFQNLIGNALKFRRSERPTIHVSAERRNDEWVFSVADNGIGLDPAKGEHVFRMFERLHARDEYEGNGIGLATARKIVERHGGRIWVDSTPGAGATFFFTLPPAYGAAYAALDPRGVVEPPSERAVSQK